MTERGTPRRKPRSGPEVRFADYRSLREVAASAMMRRLVEMEDDIVAALAGDAPEGWPEADATGPAEPEEDGESARAGEGRAEVEEPQKTPLLMELVGRPPTMEEILRELSGLADAVAKTIAVDLEGWEERLPGDGEDDEGSGAGLDAGGEVGQGPER